MTDIPMASESEFMDLDPLTSGLPQLDRICGVGGIPSKRITEISGNWSVGKTTLAYHFVKEAQKKGMPVVWYDAEWSWEGSYAVKVGVDTTKVMLLQEEYAEAALDKMLEYAADKKKKPTLMVIDAIGALHAKDEAEKGSGDRTIGSQAGLVARFCRKMVPLLAINNHILLVLNHEYTPIMSMGGRPQVKTSGGAKLEYHKSIWIRLQRAGKKLNEGEDVVGFVVNAEIKKNKVADTIGQDCELELYYGHGYSAVSDIFSIAMEKGVITKEGRTYSFNGAKFATGLEKAKAALKDELLDRVKAAI